jgi:peptide-methionine (R)-S-oxide reductase
MSDRVSKSDREWQQELTPEQYHVTRERGTEPPFSGKYYYAEQTGTYNCVCCDNELFHSDYKYDSGTGWPSFTQALAGAVHTQPDHGLLIVREEVVCARCNAHLGHVFNDGPTEAGGRRYCINSFLPRRQADGEI